jgi:hypothetical protein
MQPLDWLQTLVAALKADGLRGCRASLAAGYRFLRLSHEATRPRVILEHDATGLVEVDTGLPDLGATHFFGEQRDPTLIGLACFGGVLVLLIALIGWQDFFTSLANGQREAALSAVIGLFLVGITLGSLLALLWSAHTLLAAATRARMPLDARDGERLAALRREHHLIGVAACRDYLGLARSIVAARRELAGNEKA